MVVTKMIRGRRKSLKYPADETALRARAYPDQLIGLTHADDLDTALMLEQMIKERLPKCRTVICEIGCVL